MNNKVIRGSTFYCDSDDGQRADLIEVKSKRFENGSFREQTPEEIRRGAASTIVIPAKPFRMVMVETCLCCEL